MPSYTDIRDYLIEQAKAIYGQDIYLESDSSDYQYISIIAKSEYDTLMGCQLAYNNRSPQTAIGVALDGIVKINGIKRIPATYSTAVVTLTGAPNTLIKSGSIADINGIKWNLPETVTIGLSGTINVTATCQVLGAIYASIGDINIINTPTYGWTGVTNIASAIVGNNIELNSSLRARQAISVSQPSRTVLEGIKSSIASLVGVTRFFVYENDTNANDSNGLPPNSITAIVENGIDLDIANSIFKKKTPGVKANGTTVVNITDSYNQVTAIGFYRPSYVDIDVVINLKMLVDYTSQITTNIKQSIVDYLNQLSIGSSLSISMLWGIALSANTNLFKPNFSITALTAAKHGAAQGTVDIALLFNESARGNLANISVVVS